MPVDLVRTCLADMVGEPGGDPVAELLYAEANHRIANNLTLVAGLVRLQASKLVGEQMSVDEVRQLFAQISGRLDTVARLHRLLGESGSAESLDLGAYLSTVADTIVTSLAAPGEVRLACDVAPGVLAGPQRALAAGLAVGELLTNAIKHARRAERPPQVRVCLKRRPGRLLLIEVADDGPGLPPNVNPAESSGLGMRLMRSLAAQLNAELVFTPRRPGLSAQLRFPAEVEKSAT